MAQENDPRHMTHRQIISSVFPVFLINKLGCSYIYKFKLLVFFLKCFVCRFFQRFLFFFGFVEDFLFLDLFKVSFGFEGF